MIWLRIAAGAADRRMGAAYFSALSAGRVQLSRRQRRIMEITQGALHATVPIQAAMRPVGDDRQRLFRGL